MSVFDVFQAQASGHSGRSVFDLFCLIIYVLL
jgi:hypothetical protein